MTAVAPETLVAETAPVASQFVQYLFLKVDPEWRRLDAATRAAGRAEFADAVSATGPAITTHAYSTLGLKTGAELMLWWKSADAAAGAARATRVPSAGARRRGRGPGR